MYNQVTWTEPEYRTIIAALEEGAVPRLEPEVAERVLGAQPGPAGGAPGGPMWRVELDLRHGQPLKRWCDARREHAAEKAPNEIWTRIVARVNEAIQWEAPAKE
jgi:hypothetical protein